jgi:hypothetical protein
MSKLSLNKRKTLSFARSSESTIEKMSLKNQCKNEKKKRFSLNKQTIFDSYNSINFVQFRQKING